MKNPVIAIVALDGSGMEAAALRSVLECFGAFVAVKWVGRPNDFIEVLGGELPVTPDYIIISGHGEDNSFIMTELGESVYEPGEPRGNFTPENVKEYLKIKGVVLSTCCTTGGGAMAEAFSKGGCTYIAPDGYVEGNSALMFVTRFFYELLQNNSEIEFAFNTAQGIDAETGMFVIAQ